MVQVTLCLECWIHPNYKSEEIPALNSLFCVNSCWNPCNRWHNIRKSSIKLQENLSLELNSKIHTDLNWVQPWAPRQHSHTESGHHMVLRKIHWVTAVAFSLDAGPLPCKNMESLPYLTIFTGVPWLRYPCRREFYCVSHQPGSIPQIPVFQKCKKLALPLFPYSFTSEFFSVSIRTRNISFNFFQCLCQAQIKAEVSTCTGKNRCEPYTLQGIPQISWTKDCTAESNQIDLTEHHGLDKICLGINKKNQVKI